MAGVIKSGDSAKNSSSSSYSYSYSYSSSKGGSSTSAARRPHRRSARFSNRRNLDSVWERSFSVGGEVFPVGKISFPTVANIFPTGKEIDPYGNDPVELSWRLVRFQPGYPPVKKRLAILAPGARATGAARKKAIVAVARQLAVDRWRWQTGQCTAEKLGLANPPAN